MFSDAGFCRWILLLARQGKGMNRYPFWKYLLVALTLVVGLVYALPSLYEPAPAVEVSGTRYAEVTDKTPGEIRSALTDAGIPFGELEILPKNKLRIRLEHAGDQLKTKHLLQQKLGEDYVIALNLVPQTPEWLASLGGSPVNLGLDLRGGVHFLIEVDVDAAVAARLEQNKTEFRSTLREEKIRPRGVKVSGKNSLLIRFRDQDTLDQAEEFMANRFPSFTFNQSKVEGLFELRALLSDQARKEIQDYALQQNLSTLKNRVNELGVAEPLVQRQGANRIVVQMPGVQDAGQAQDIIGKTATLEFRMTDWKNDLNSALNGRVPAESKVYKWRDGRPVLLQKRVMLTGDRVIDAKSTSDENGLPAVSITLDSRGGRLFSRATRDNIGKPMAVVYQEHKIFNRLAEDGTITRIPKKIEEVISVATIRSQLGSRFQITGLDSPQEAHELALFLRAGALSAPIYIVETRTVGPSLGQENIDRGLKSVALGLAMVLLFMLVYYRFFGLVANVALVINLVMVVALLSLSGATLTLPGIAGIVLTVGMAVDANVLIFERIREELRDGKSPAQAIEQGYAGAFSTIIDANVTTLLVAIVLFAIGFGPIKGFAITLALGIMTSMFTAIVVSRAMVNLIYGGRSPKTLSI